MAVFEKIERQRLSQPKSIPHCSIQECTEQALINYLKSNSKDLYSTVINNVEIPLFKIIMSETKGNESKAAKILGISRTTLRKKLSEYHLKETSY